MDESVNLQKGACTLNLPPYQGRGWSLALILLAVSLMLKVKVLACALNFGLRQQQMENEDKVSEKLPLYAYIYIIYCITLHPLTIPLFSVDVPKRFPVSIIFFGNSRLKSVRNYHGKDNLLLVSINQIN